MMRPSRAAREVRLRYASGFYRQSAALLIQSWKASRMCEESDVVAHAPPSDNDSAAARSPPVKMVKGQALGPAQEGFPGTYPTELLESLQPGLDVGMAREDYPAWWMSEAKKQSEARGCLSELEELLSTGRSYGRGTEWAVMDIQPWAAFTLHAHGTIEVIHIVRGALYEKRVAGPVVYRERDPSATLGPDLSKTEGVVFEEGCFRQGGIYVNEVGSIHQSFTRDEGCLLLCIWGGSHLNLPPEHWPPTYDPAIS